MSKVKQLKEMFDNMDKEEQSDEEYNDIEGENIVIRGQKSKVKQNIKNADEVKEKLKKYKGKTVAYSKIKEIQEQNEDEDEINSDNIGEDSNEEEEEEEEDNEEEIEEEEEKKEEESEEEEKEEEPKDTKENMDKNDEAYLKQLTQYTPSEIKKAKNVQNQKNIYDFFIGFRISLQSLLTLINSLPSYENFQSFLSKSDEQTQSVYLQIKSSLLTLLQSLLTVHKKLIMKSNIPAINEFDPITEINEIISSLSSDDENSYENLLSFHNKLNQINQKVINIWYRKSIVNSFKDNNKIIKQLNNDYCSHILQNVSTNYESLRKNTRKTKNEKLLGRKRENEEDYDFDKEIYNDVDFYNFVLKDFLLSNEKEIDSTEYDNSNRMDLTMKHILNRQEKTKKNVDTKASKNRKIRFDKHEKIINFMTPQINLNEAIGRDIIVNSLFGIKKKIDKKNEEEIENDVDII